MHKASSKSWGADSPWGVASRTVSSTATAAFLVGIAAMLASGSARADGAFPDSQGLLLPADQPNQIMLATTFGVVISIDGGQTWTYSCEQMANGSLAAFYNIGPPPRDRLFALTDIALIYSDDHACTWSKAGGMLAGKPAVDYFPDAANADRVWAARGPDTPGGSYTIVESTDGGATFTTIRFTSAVGDVITGVELAKSDANTAYVTLRNGTNFAPKLSVTKDDGATWTTRDLSTTTIGTSNIRLISIDPANPSKIFLRVSIPSGAAQGDGVALSLDGGVTFVTPQPISLPGGVLTSFARLPDGTLLIGGVDLVKNVIFRSTDGGMHFTEMSSPTVRGLGQRNGIVYVAANNDDTAGDGYALGRSTDQGTTFVPLMSFDQIQAISSCAKSICQDDCNLKVNLGIWSADVCTADPMPLPVDGGADSGAGSGVGGHPTDAGSDAGIHVMMTDKGGCACGTGAGRAATAGINAAAGIGLCVWLLASRQFRRRRAAARPTRVKNDGNDHNDDADRQT